MRPHPSLKLWLTRAEPVKVRAIFAQTCTDIPIASRLLSAGIHQDCGTRSGGGGRRSYLELSGAIFGGHRKALEGTASHCPPLAEFTLSRQVEQRAPCCGNQTRSRVPGLGIRAWVTREPPWLAEAVLELGVFFPHKPSCCDVVSGMAFGLTCGAEPKLEGNFWAATL